MLNFSQNFVPQNSLNQIFNKFYFNAILTIFTIILFFFLTWIFVFFSLVFHKCIYTKKKMKEEISCAALRWKLTDFSLAWPTSHFLCFSFSLRITEALLCSESQLLRFLYINTTNVFFMNIFPFDVFLSIGFFFDFHTLAFSLSHSLGYVVMTQVVRSYSLFCVRI